MLTPTNCSIATAQVGQLHDMGRVLPVSMATVCMLEALSKRV